MTSSGSDRALASALNLIFLARGIPAVFYGTEIRFMAGAEIDGNDAPHATSGTPFRQIAEDCAARGWPFRYACLGASRFANTAALFDRAAALGAHVVLDEALATPADAADALAAWLADLDHLYLTICLDALPPDPYPEPD